MALGRTPGLAILSWIIESVTCVRLEVQEVLVPSDTRGNGLCWQPHEYNNPRSLKSGGLRYQHVDISKWLSDDDSVMLGETKYHCCCRKSYRRVPYMHSTVLPDLRVEERQYYKDSEVGLNCKLTDLTGVHFGSFQCNDKLPKWSHCEDEVSNRPPEGEVHWDKFSIQTNRSQWTGTKNNPGWGCCVTEVPDGLCPDGRDPMTGCHSCLPNYDAEQNCEACTTGFDIATGCKKCLAGWSAEAAYTYHWKPENGVTNPFSGHATEQVMVCKSDEN